MPRNISAEDEPTVREYGGTYIARWRGRTASCTCGAEEAVAAVRRKVVAAEAAVVGTEEGT